MLARLTSPRLRVWIRDLHLYTGLLISPFVAVFAVSTVLLNHTWKPWTTQAQPEVRVVPLAAPIPEGLDNLQTARWLREQLGFSGDVGYLSRDGQRVTTYFERPGVRVDVEADLAAGTATLTHTRTDLWERLIYLHRSPGPHLAGFRGNWVFTRIWRSLADATVAILLFSTVSGLYLWLLLRAERRTGLALLGAGATSFVLLLLALTA